MSTGLTKRSAPEFVESPQHSRPGEQHAAYLDNMNKLKILRVGACFEAWKAERLKRSGANSSVRRFMPRMVLVPDDSGITSDQNANAWLNGREYKDIIVNDIESLPSNLPSVIRDVAIAAYEAAKENPLA